MAPVCRPGPLARLFEAARLDDIEVRAFDIPAAFASFDDYWAPVEAGVGSIPQAYLMLSDAERRMVRDEVRAELSRFSSATGLRMSVEMLIGQARPSFEAFFGRPPPAEVDARAAALAALRTMP